MSACRYGAFCSVPQSEIDAARGMAAYGWWKNVDFTDDPAQVKWSQFIADPRYAAENIGCYEGDSALTLLLIK